MRKIREVFRLRFELNMTFANIATSVSVGETTVRNYITRAARAGIHWPFCSQLDDEALENLLFPPKPVSSRKQEIIFFEIHKELKRKGVTLQLLWEEYIDINPQGYSYSHYCDLYRDWACQRKVWMPQQHKAGEAIFVDYAGQTVPVYDERTGTYFEAQIFVGVLGASNYTYVEATKTQTLEDWIESHCRMFSFFGGVSEILVPDNLKSGVTSPHRYEPDCNLTYLGLAEHYGVAVIPARVRKPQDKAKVEQTVLDAERRILAKIRNQIFFSLNELNSTIKELLKDLNNRPFQKIPGTRYSLYQELEKPILKQLPVTPYEFAYWEKKLVGHNYHVNIGGHYYSTPYKYVKKSVDISFNDKTVQIFYRGRQIAFHVRKFQVGEYTTVDGHRPQGHQSYANCTPENLLKEAETIGLNAIEWVQKVLTDDSLHIKQRVRVCSGVLRLSKSYTPERLDAALKRAMHFNLFTYKSIKSTLKNNLEKQLLPGKIVKMSLPQQHDNIRGADYYDQPNKENKYVNAPSY